MVKLDNVFSPVEARALRSSTQSVKTHLYQISHMWSGGEKGTAGGPGGAHRTQIDVINSTRLRR